MPYVADGNRNRYGGNVIRDREETSEALETKNMVYSSVGYCECGYEVWIEYLWNGKEWYQRFFDADHHEIETCPDCGKELKEDELESLSD